MNERAPRPRTAFVLPKLNGGGAERAALRLAAARTDRCVVIAERSGGELQDDPLAAEVVFAGGEAARRNRVARVVHLRRALAHVRADIAVSVLSPAVVATAAQSLRIPVMFWLQNPVSEYIPTTASGGPTTAGRFAVRSLARGAEVIAGATPGLSGEWEAAGVPKRKLATLPNGVQLPSLRPADRRRSRETPLKILSVGRLAAQKRHDVLLNAFAQVTRAVPAHLTILGTGTLLAQLHALASQLGVEDSVTFEGFVPDPAPYFAHSDLFALASDFEGFGNVLVEALGHGLPIVATDVPFGPRFILEGVPSARLVRPGDPVALGDAIVASLAEAASPTAAALARRRAERFSIARTAAHFDALAAAIVTSTPPPSWPEVS